MWRGKKRNNFITFLLLFIIVGELLGILTILNILPAWFSDYALIILLLPIPILVITVVIAFLLNIFRSHK